MQRKTRIALYCANWQNVLSLLFFARASLFFSERFTPFCVIKLTFLKIILPIAFFKRQKPTIKKFSVADHVNKTIILIKKHI